MRRTLVALAAGIVFGLGLAMSGMTDPARVIGFLDVAGRWDPTLAFVMGGALLVTLPAFRLLRLMRSPVFAPSFVMPTKRDLDARLLAGAGLFGVGWGLAGLCPGPALTALVSGRGAIVAFVLAMIAGQLVYRATMSRAA